MKPVFAWYDIWVGVFVDKAKKRIYVFPVPCFGLMLQWKGDTRTHYYDIARHPHAETECGKPKRKCGFVTDIRQVTCRKCLAAVDGKDTLRAGGIPTRSGAMRSKKATARRRGVFYWLPSTYSSGWRR